MSKAPPAPRPPPTAYQLEQSVSLWMSLRHAAVVDDPLFEADEDAIDAAIIEAGREPPRRMLARLVDAAIMLDQKADHLDSLRRRYAEKRDRYISRKDRVRNTIEQLLAVLGDDAAEGELGSAGFAKPRKSVQITDFAKLPEEFVRRHEPEAKKQDIAAAIRAGKEVPGAEMSDGNGPPVLRVVPY